MTPTLADRLLVAGDVDVHRRRLDEQPFPPRTAVFSTTSGALNSRPPIRPESSRSSPRAPLKSAGGGDASDAGSEDEH
jgi:hypothetical protein